MGLNYEHLKNKSNYNYFAVVIYLFTFVFSDCVKCFEQNKNIAVNSSDTSDILRKYYCNEEFWNCINEKHHVSILDSPLAMKVFNKAHSNTFIMFYTSWCKYSKQAREGFAKAAQEIAYTEGYSHIRFGAFDCNASSDTDNKMFCIKEINVTHYPTFIYFKNEQRDRKYSSSCPHSADSFYSWILYDEGNGHFCSESESLAMATSSSSGLITTIWQYSSPVFYVILLFYCLHLLTPAEYTIN